MASAFAHIAIPAVLYAGFRSDSVNFKLFLLGAFCSVVPDIDVISLEFDVVYGSPWYHRGFTHSLVFALALALLLSAFHRQVSSKPWIVFLFCFTSCASHAFLDAMTNGGLGVALYWPFNLERIFLPFRPIQVSPTNINKFFTEWGLRALASELVWVFSPALIIGTLSALLRRTLTRSRSL